MARQPFVAVLHPGGGLVRRYLRLYLEDIRLQTPLERRAGWGCAGHGHSPPSGRWISCTLYWRLDIHESSSPKLMIMDLMKDYSNVNVKNVTKFAMVVISATECL